MKPTDDMKKLFKNAAISTNPKADEMVFGKVLTAQEKALKARPALAEPNIWSIIMRSKIMRLVATVVVIITVSISISYIVKDHDGSIAFGDVVKAMQEVKTATWTSICESKPPEDMTGIVWYSISVERQSAYKAPGLEREEVVSKSMRVSEGGSYLEERRGIHIYDYNAGKSLILNPEKMTASVNTFEPAHRIASLFDAFLSPKTSIPPDAEPLGARQIDGREAFGFRFRLKGDGTDFLMGDVSEIWVDATTKLLVLAETRDDENRWITTLKDFVFNLELDDSLFSVEVPEGYKDIGPTKFMSAEPPKDE
jgi:outer membrane lipoprotein-sorting protein